MQAAPPVARALPGRLLQAPQPGLPSSQFKPQSPGDLGSWPLAGSWHDGLAPVTVTGSFQPL